VIAAANATYSDHETAKGQNVSPLAAGFIGNFASLLYKVFTCLILSLGAGVTLITFVCLFGAAFFLLGFHRKQQNGSRKQSAYQLNNSMDRASVSGSNLLKFLVLIFICRSRQIPSRKCLYPTVKKRLEVQKSGICMRTGETV